jgi:hypothetical protein
MPQLRAEFAQAFYRVMARGNWQEAFFSMKTLDVAK